MGGDAIYFLFFHFSNIYHPIQVGSAYSNSILKEKLERLVIKIRKMISIFRTNNINIFMKNKEDLIKTKMLDRKLNVFLINLIYFFNKII